MHRRVEKRFTTRFPRPGIGVFHLHLLLIIYLREPSGAFEKKLSTSNCSRRLKAPRTFELLKINRALFQLAKKSTLTERAREIRYPHAVTLLNAAPMPLLSSLQSIFFSSCQELSVGRAPLATPDVHTQQGEPYGAPHITSTSQRQRARKQQNATVQRGERGTSY
jgi:hypothetical protein